MQIEKGNKHILPTVLVIGSDSLIGSALVRFLKRVGITVIGTTRRV